MKREAWYLLPRLAVSALCGFAGGLAAAGQRYPAWSPRWVIGMVLAVLVSLVALAILDGLIVRRAAKVEYDRGYRAGVMRSVKSIGQDYCGLALAALAAWDAREAAGARMQHAAFHGPDTDVWSEADQANSDSWAEAEDALTDAMDQIREATR